MSSSTRPIEVIGHGGAGDFYPGNSRQAIEQALKIGVDRIEFDVQRSADADIVLVHDDDVQLAIGSHAAVRALSTEELRRTLPGLLTLTEIAELIGDAAKLLIDVKAPGYERELVDQIRRLNLQHTAAVSSTYASVLWKMRAAFPDLRLGLSTGHLSTGLHAKLARKVVSSGLQVVTPLPLVVVARALKATDVMIQYRVCTPRLVRTMHEHGLRVNAWTVDHPRQIQRMIDMGVDGIISNRPDLVREALGFPETM